MKCPFSLSVSFLAKAGVEMTLRNRVRIPEPLKRRLRQEAGFGCCKCGYPVFEYHHIIPRSEDSEDLMILCPICHHEATVGAMPEEEQRFFKSHPFNIVRGYVKGKLKINQRALAVTIGSNQFVGDGCFILVDQEEVISVSTDITGKLALSAKLYDRDDHLLVAIEDNEWISGDPFPWDLESRFQWLKMRRKIGDIALEIDARKFPIEIYADIWRKGQNFQLSRDWIRFNGVQQNIGFKDLCFVALRLAVDTQEKKFKIEPDLRFGKGMFISWPDVQERVKKGLESWERLKTEKI